MVPKVKVCSVLPASTVPFFAYLLNFLVTFLFLPIAYNFFLYFFALLYLSYFCIFLSKSRRNWTRKGTSIFSGPLVFCVDLPEHTMHPWCTHSPVANIIAWTVVLGLLYWSFELPERKSAIVQWNSKRKFALHVTMSPGCRSCFKNIYRYKKNTKHSETALRLLISA